MNNKPTRRELDCIAAIGMAAAIGVFIQAQAPEEDKKTLKPLCDILDAETMKAFRLWPLYFTKKNLSEIERKFDAVKDKFLKEPKKMQLLIDYSLALLDPHLTRLKDGEKRKEALNDVVGILYAIRAYFDPPCEDIDSTSAAAAVEWGVAI